MSIPTLIAFLRVAGKRGFKQFATRFGLGRLVFERIF
jgi:hypothetical protein